MASIKDIASAILDMAEQDKGLSRGKLEELLRDQIGQTDSEKVEVLAAVRDDVTTFGNGSLHVNADGSWERTSPKAIVEAIQLLNLPRHGRRMVQNEKQNP